MQGWKIAVSSTLALSIIAAGMGIPQAKAADGAITVTMLTHWDATTVKQFQPYITEYQKLHPYVKIQLQTVDFADLLSKISADELAGNGPDIYHIYSLWLPELVKNGAVAPAVKTQLDDIKAGYGANVVSSASVQGST